MLDMKELIEDNYNNHGHPIKVLETLGFEDKGKNDVPVIFQYIMIINLETGILYEGIDTTWGDYLIETELNEQQLKVLPEIVEAHTREIRYAMEQYKQHGEQYLKERIYASRETEWRKGGVRCFENPSNSYMGNRRNKERFNLRY